MGQERLRVSGLDQGGKAAFGRVIAAWTAEERALAGVVRRYGERYALAR